MRVDLLWCQTQLILVAFSPPCWRICKMECAFTVISWHMIAPKGERNVCWGALASSCLVTLWPAILVSEGIRVRERPAFIWPLPVKYSWCAIKNTSLRRSGQQSASCHTASWIRWSHCGWKSATTSTQRTFLSKIEWDTNWIFSLYLTWVPCDKYK